MSIIDSLIYNRTQQDLDQETAEGFYEATDLNRVGLAVKYIAERLLASGYNVHVSPKTDWMDDEWLTPATAAAYLADVRELQRHLAMMESTPTLASDLEFFDWREANYVEKILKDLDTMLTSVAGTRIHSAQPMAISGFLFYPISDSELLQKDGAVLGSGKLGAMRLGIA